MPTVTAVSARHLLVAVAISSLFGGACAQPFSELQSARMAGPKSLELTPAYSRVTYAEDGQHQTLQSNYGLHAAYGLSSKVDLRARFERIQFKGDSSLQVDGGGVNVLAVGPKISLITDRLAFYAPVGVAWGSDIEANKTWELHPTIIGTLPMSRYAELNASAKALIPLNPNGRDNLVAVNIGLGLGQDVSQWAIRPEVGMLANPGESGRFYHWSVGVTKYFR